MPSILVWALKLASLDDQAKLDALAIKLQPYDAWNFKSWNPLFGAEHSGRIPGDLVAFVLYLYTEPGELVVDPMAGSGSTVACTITSHFCEIHGGVEVRILSLISSSEGRSTAFVTHPMVSSSNPARTSYHIPRVDASWYHEISQG